METTNNATQVNVQQPQSPAAGQVITPEIYDGMSQEQKNALPPDVRNIMEAQVQQLKAMNNGQVPHMELPNVLQQGQPAVNQDKVQTAAPAAPKEWENLSVKEQKEIRKEFNEAHPVASYEFWKVDITSSNDRAAMLAGAIMATVFIIGGYYLIRWIKTN